MCIMLSTLSRCHHVILFDFIVLVNSTVAHCNSPPLMASFHL